MKKVILAGVMLAASMGAAAQNTTHEGIITQP